MRKVNHKNLFLLRTERGAKQKKKSFSGVKARTYWHIFHSRCMCKELSVQVFPFPVIRAKKISSFICWRLHLKAGKEPWKKTVSNWPEGDISVSCLTNRTNILHSCAQHIYSTFFYSNLALCWKAYSRFSKKNPLLIKLWILALSALSVFKSLIP